jgi:DNA-binding NarL/FixJ family response regulator
MNDCSQPGITRVVLIDDHPLIRDGLRSCLTARPHLVVCGEADDVASALILIDEFRPHLAIVDLSLRNGSGIDLIKRIVARGFGTRVLVASMMDESLYAERAIQAGALGFVHKEEASRKIVEAAERVLTGKIYVSDRVMDRLLSRAVQGGSEPGGSPLEQLSDRELEVFEQIGTGQSVREIAETLDLSPKTVETYRDRIKRKLNLASAAQLNHFAVRWVTERRT